MLRQYFIHSSNRTANSTSSSYFSVPINPPLYSPKSCKLKWISIPNVIYNIRTGVNDQFSFTNGTPYTLTIPAGAYSDISFCDTLMDLMNGVGTQEYSVVFNEVTMKITISCATAFSLQLSGARTCADVIGFEKTNTTSQLSFTGTKCATFYIDSIFMTINEFPSTLFNNNLVYTFAIPITKNSTQVIQYKDRDYFSQEVQLFGSTISNIVVQLLHKSGERVDLNGSEWSFMLEFN